MPISLVAVPPVETDGQTHVCRMPALTNSSLASIPTDRPINRVSVEDFRLHCFARTSVPAQHLTARQAINFFVRLQ